MDEFEKKLSWLVLIAPGLVSLYLAAEVAGASEINEFQVIFYALALTLVNTSIAGVILRLFGARADYTARVYLFIVLVVSLLVGLFMGLVIERDYLHRAVRALPGTDSLLLRSKKRPIDFILSQNSAGQLHIDGDGRREKFKVSEAWLRIVTEEGSYEGWPEYWDAQLSHIYLSPACKVSNGTNAEPIMGPGVFVPEERVQVAFLLDRQASSCFDTWETLASESSTSTEGTQ